MRKQDAVTCGGDDMSIKSVEKVTEVLVTISRNQRIKNDKAKTQQELN